MRQGERREKPPKKTWWQRQSVAARVAAIIAVNFWICAAAVPLLVIFLREDTKRLPAAETWARGDVRVGINDAAVINDDLVISIVVSTSNHDGVYYPGWRNAGYEQVKLIDDSGMEYYQRPVRLSVDGRYSKHWMQSSRHVHFGPGLLSPDQARTELLIFTKPQSTAEYLDLDLAARIVGHSGTIRFRLPATMWRSSSQIQE